MKKQGAPRRDQFPREYLVDFNATKAAQRCGYSKKSAYAQGSRLLKNDEIQKTLRALQKTRADKHEETFDKWMTELVLIAHSDLKNYIDITEDTGAIRAKGFDAMPKDASRALESITENRTIHENANGEQSVINEKVTFKMHNKLGALEMIGKSFGWLKDKVEHSGELNIQFIMPRPKDKK